MKTWPHLMNNEAMGGTYSYSEIFKVDHDGKGHPHVLFR